MVTDVNKEIKMDTAFARESMKNKGNQIVLETLNAACKYDPGKG